MTSAPARLARARGARLGEIAGDVAHHGIELGQRDAKAIGHGRCLEHVVR